MRKGLLLVLLVVPYALSSCSGKNYESFVRECQQGAYSATSALYPLDDLGSHDVDSFKDMVSQVEEVNGYLSLRYTLQKVYAPTTHECRQKDGVTFLADSFGGWHRVSDGETFYSWEKALVGDTSIYGGE